MLARGLLGTLKAQVARWLGAQVQAGPVDALTARLVAGGWIQVRVDGLHVLHAPSDGDALRWLRLDHLETLLVDAPAQAGRPGRRMQAAQRIGTVWGLRQTGVLDADTATAYLVAHVLPEEAARMLARLMGQADPQS